MKKILIIEDEGDIASLERDYLEVNGFKVDIAASGGEGLRLAMTNNYHLILLDIMLPEMNGFELCQKLRKHLNIPILMVTAKEEDIDKIRGFDRGADDYIVKPFNPNELVARVKAHISRYERLLNHDQKPNDLQIRGLLIQRDERRVFVNNKEKFLTAKEFDLLTYLATNPNIVFTKEHLMERIWGFDSWSDPSTVTVHIRKIREKIEENPSQPQYIETIWGVGYRLRK